MFPLQLQFSHVNHTLKGSNVQDKPLSLPVDPRFTSWMCISSNGITECALRRPDYSECPLITDPWQQACFSPDFPFSGDTTGLTNQSIFPSRHSHLPPCEPVTAKEVLSDFAPGYLRFVGGVWSSFLYFYTQQAERVHYCRMERVIHWLSTTELI